MVSYAGPLLTMNAGEERAKAIGAQVLRFRRVASTMDKAWRLADAGAAHGVVVIAGEQTAGRGRFSRRWESGEGDCLMASALLRPPPDAAPLLSVAGALAAADAAERAAGVVCAFKWPNDALAGGRKLCGVLVETRADGNGNVISVLGVGLNVNLRPQEHPRISESATSLAAEAGREFAADAVERAFIAALQERYAQCVDDPRGLVADWSARLSTLGREVSVRLREGALRGVAESVDASGRLILRLASGERKTLADGEVAFIPA